MASLFAGNTSGCEECTRAFRKLFNKRLSSEGSVPESTLAQSKTSQFGVSFLRRLNEMDQLEKKGRRFENTYQRLAYTTLTESLTDARGAGVLEKEGERAILEYMARFYSENLESPAFAHIEATNGELTELFRKVPLKEGDKIITGLDVLQRLDSYKKNEKKAVVIRRKAELDQIESAKMLRARLPIGVANDSREALILQVKDQVNALLRADAKRDQIATSNSEKINLYRAGELLENLDKLASPPAAGLEADALNFYRVTRERLRKVTIETRLTTEQKKLVTPLLQLVGKSDLIRGGNAQLPSTDAPHDFVTDRLRFLLADRPAEDLGSDLGKLTDGMIDIISEKANTKDILAAPFVYSRWPRYVVKGQHAIAGKPSYVFLDPSGRLKVIHGARGKQPYEVEALRIARAENGEYILDSEDPAFVRKENGQVVEKEAAKRRCLACHVVDKHSGKLLTITSNQAVKSGVTGKRFYNRLLERFVDDPDFQLHANEWERKDALKRKVSDFPNSPALTFEDFLASGAAHNLNDLSQVPLMEIKRQE